MKIEEIEGQIEKQKQILIKLKQFDCYSSFTQLDTENKGYLEAIDIYNFLEDFLPIETQQSLTSPYQEIRRNQIYNLNYSYMSTTNSKSQLCRALVNFFDIDNDGKLEYVDYKYFISPIETTGFNPQTSNFDSMKYKSLPYEVINELTKLFELELTYQKEVELRKQEQENSPYFSVVKSFKYFDEEKDGAIPLKIFEQTVKYEKSPVIFKEILSAIIRKIKIIGADKLTFNEYALMLTPASSLLRSNSTPKLFSYSPRKESVAEDTPIIKNRSPDKAQEPLITAKQFSDQNKEELKEKSSSKLKNL